MGACMAPAAASTLEQHFIDFATFSALAKWLDVTQTTLSANPPATLMVPSASVVGPKEGQGPLGLLFDVVGEDDMFGCETWVYTGCSGFTLALPNF